VSFELTIHGQQKLRDVARALRQANRRDLQRGLQKAIRDGAKPTLDAVRRSAREIQTEGIRRPGARRPFTMASLPKGLREKIAAACVADIRTRGEDPLVRFRVAESRLPANIRVMPRKFDDGGTFRHPVMGNRNVWVSQTGDPWFWPPIRDHIKTFRALIDAELDKVKEKIEHS
jgi:hypothetical protein